MVPVDFKCYDFSENEIAEVRNKFPKLTIQSEGVWDGEIEVDAIFGNIHIKDTFTIGIVATDKYPVEIPSMIELGGRTDAIAEKYKIKNRQDLHYNIKSRVACLCVKQEEKIKFPQGSNLVKFIDDLVIPYLYGLSYFDQYGKWPWGEYSHGGLGLLEFYAEDKSEQKIEDIKQTARVFVADNNWKEYGKQIRKPSAEKACICGSGRQFQRCHPSAWKGILRLNIDIKRLGLNPNNLYRR